MTQINTFLIFFLSCQMCLMNLKMNLKKHILLVIFITSVLLLFFSFKQGTGDPEGFKLFLSELGVPIGSFPRYVGNRLHVLFHIACFIVRHMESFRVFLKGNNYQGHLPHRNLNIYRLSESVEVLINLVIIVSLPIYSFNHFRKIVYLLEKHYSFTDQCSQIIF